ncbi:SAF domain-containing protein [Ornithinimicrobium sufpigmenti]|uniref:SAF domain-containing protein n=1 Tax=Ornithinimicrobium sufpigmenti TaxID=2508882 RepID=UPI0011AE5DC7|nr:MULTISPECIES: SAF domain-containing protein [unclassified Ornithinimicrobium]
MSTQGRRARPLPAAGGDPGAKGGRTARRLQRPGWRDLRLVVGVLLVLLSVAGGTRLVMSLDDTTPVYAAARDLLPGQPVAAADLAVVQVRLGEQVERYVDGTEPIAPGTYLVRGVATGELVPVASLGTAREALDKTVTVPVDPSALPGLSTGALVDVWVSPRDPDALGVSYLDPRLLLSGAVVDRVPEQGTGLGAGLGRASVSVVVPADRVGDVIAAVDQDARLTLVPAPRSQQDAGR